MSFDPKRADEIVRLAFNFNRLLSAVDTAQVECVLLKGKADPNVATMVKPASTSIDGVRVSALIQNGLAGNTYLVRCAVTDGSGQRLVEEAELVVR